MEEKYEGNLEFKEVFGKNLFDGELIHAEYLKPGELNIFSYQIGMPDPENMAPIINIQVRKFDDNNVSVYMSKRDFETLAKYAYIGQVNAK